MTEEVDVGGLPGARLERISRRVMAAAWGLGFAVWFVAWLVASFRSSHGADASPSAVAWQLGLAVGLPCLALTTWHCVTVDRHRRSLRQVARSWRTAHDGWPLPEPFEPAIRPHAAATFWAGMLGLAGAISLGIGLFGLTVVALLGTLDTWADVAYVGTPLLAACLCLGTMAVLMRVRRRQILTRTAYIAGRE